MEAESESAPPNLGRAGLKRCVGSQDCKVIAVRSSNGDREANVKDGADLAVEHHRDRENHGTDSSDDERLSPVESKSNHGSC